MARYPEACYNGSHVSGDGYTECCADCGYNVWGPPPPRDDKPREPVPMRQEERPWNGCTPSKHLGPVQEYTEHCFNCGRNIYS